MLQNHRVRFGNCLVEVDNPPTTESTVIPRQELVGVDSEALDGQDSHWVTEELLVGCITSGCAWLQGLILKLSLPLALQYRALKKQQTPRTSINRMKCRLKRAQPTTMRGLFHSLITGQQYYQNKTLYIYNPTTIIGGLKASSRLPDILLRSPWIPLLDSRITPLDGSLDLTRRGCGPRGSIGYYITMDIQYKEYPYRFVIAALFALPSFINGTCWVTLSPVLKKTAQTYGLAENLVSLVPLLYLIMYLFINFPSNWILDVKGIRKGVIIGAVMTALGAGIRCFINVSFIYVIIGQFFCAVAQPFILNAPAKIATFWFKEKNRPVWTAILATVNIVGSGVGYVIPAAIVDENADKETARSQFFLLMMVEFILSLTGALLVIFLFRQSPATPPSYAADADKISFKKSFKLLLKNKNFLLLLGAFAAVNGTFCFIGSMMNLILAPFDYSDNQTSILGGCMIGVGLFAACGLSLYVEKVGKYRGVFVLCSLVAITSSLGFMLCLYYLQSFAILLGLTLLMGSSLTPLLPLSFDFGCEIVFPVGEAQVTGILMTSGQIVGIIEIVILQNVYGMNDKWHCFVCGIVMSVVLSVGCIGYLLVKQNLLRQQQQRIAVSSKESLIT